MKLGIDIDGVVLDFVSAFCRVCQRHGYLLAYESIFCHDLGQVLGLGRTAVGSLVAETLGSGLVRPYSGAIEGLRELRRTGHRVELITSRPQFYQAVTESILHQYSIEYDKLVFSPYLKKVEQVEGLDVMVEDSLEEALALFEVPLEILVMRHPWNHRSLNVTGRLRFVDGWRDLISVINHLPHKA